MSWAACYGWATNRDAFTAHEILIVVGAGRQSRDGRIARQRLQCRHAGWMVLAGRKPIDVAFAPESIILPQSALAYDSRVTAAAAHVASPRLTLRLKSPRPSLDGEQPPRAFLMSD